ncbi:hypothetical protein [Flavobacterium sp.]|uniref:hypothetical protein n=1 Tax=Flavobacterium sp. TaxID=239 RepID=UPI00286B5085|nr:hypothetical protein [Flavobacterium sp.]
MKSKNRISTTLILLLGLVSFGQDSNQNQITADNSLNSQTVTENENKPMFVSRANDSTKGKTIRDVPWFVKRFKISAGFYETINNTNIRVGNNSGNIGTSIDFENSLGFSQYSPSFFADVQWRSTSRSRFILSYYNLRRNAKYRIRESLNFGDHTYNVNADVYAYFNTAIYRFSYGYTIISKPKYEMGLLIGTHIIGAKAGIGLITTGNISEVNDSFGFTAPLPDFGIWGGYAFNNRWALNGEFDYLAVKINNIKGQILGYNLALTMKTTDYLDLSVGVSGLSFKVDAYSDNLNGHLRWGNNGAFLKATYTFGHNNWN